MLAHQFLEDYFKREYDKVLNKADENGFSKLNQEDKTILLLNYHTNHYNHLEIELNQKIDNLDEKVDTGLKAVNDKIDQVEERLNNKIDTGLKEVNDKIDTGLKEVKDEIKEIHLRFDDKFDKMNERMNTLFFKFIISMGFLLGLYQFVDKYFA